MYLIDSTGNVAGQFTNGVPGTVAPTVVDASWLNAVQNEIAFCVTSTGTPLLKSNSGQLYAAMQHIASSTTLGFTPVQQGGGTGMGSNKVYLGWNSTTTKPILQIDSSSLGALALETYVAENYLSLTGGAINGSLSCSGSMSIAGLANLGSLGVFGSGQINGNLQINGSTGLQSCTAATMNVASNAVVNGTLSVAGVINTASQMSLNNGLTSSGALLCGITSNSNPSAQGLPGIIVAPEGSINCYSQGSTFGTSNGTFFALTYQTGGVVGSITSNGASTAFNTTSDYRLKANLIPLVSAIDRVNSVPVYRGNFISTPSSTVDMFLAHEAAIGVPEAVTGTKDATETTADVVLSASGNIIEAGVAQADYDASKYATGSTWVASVTLPVYQQIDQSKLLPVLWAANQELSAANVALTARVTALEAAIAALQTAVTALQPAK